MCTPQVHTFIYYCPAAPNVTTVPIPVGLPCVCGRERWGTAAELVALDEVARLEAWWAVPWHEPTRYP